MTVTYWNDAHKKRAMKSFAAFLVEQPRVYSSTAGKFICRECGGSGRVIADYERPDPVEGYKMADRVTCPSCGGTKYTTEKDYRDFFKAEQAEYRKPEKEDKRINALRKQALKKLTREERDALGVH